MARRNSQTFNNQTSKPSKQIKTFQAPKYSIHSKPTDQRQPTNHGSPTVKPDLSLHTNTQNRPQHRSPTFKTDQEHCSPSLPSAQNRPITVPAFLLLLLLTGLDVRVPDGDHRFLRPTRRIRDPRRSGIYAVRTAHGTTVALQQ